MANKKSTVNFFQIIPKYDNITSPKEIRECLKEFGKIQSFDLMDSSAYVHSINKPLEHRRSGNYMRGVIFKTQMKNIPPSMDIDNRIVNKLQLSDSAGLLKVACFIIEPTANILAIESGNGVSPQTLLKYIREHTGMGSVEAGIIIEPGQIKKFYDMGSVYEVEANLARVQNGTLLSEGGEKSISQITKSADNTDTDLLTYRISVSPETKRNKGTLRLGKVRDMVRGLLNYKDTDEVKKLKVTGKVDGEDKAISLELVEERLYEEFYYQVDDRLIADYNTSDRLEQVERLYIKNRDSILKTYSIDDEG
ncbi:hypothetical protein [Salibacter halophilus]|uniref:DUF4747 family protein n=1 Tax=Salibacter halophilus TaxID=1803916 RepID=A0A6N6M4N7_9FLAO|nr:hypothetical protein [Salibacter halophilus]KAB1064441.1 hypothetical protein F3059_07010 [Salibacter halophilus]